jgi:hypothetical protein
MARTRANLKSLQSATPLQVVNDVEHPEMLPSIDSGAAGLPVANPRPIRLGPSSNVVASLLTIPLFVLNARANDKNVVARDSGELFYTWMDRDKERGFVFKRPKGVPFPLPEHAELFYVLLAMFATRFNESGVVYFRLVDIAKNAGKTTSHSVFERVREMIWRYSQCTVSWDAGWRFKKAWNNQEDPSTWGGPLIIAQNIFSAKTTTTDGIKEAQRIISDSGEAAPYRWYSVTLHPAIVGAVGDHLVRRFLTQPLQNNDISDTTKCVYRHFNGFSNLSAVKRTYDHLMMAFAWKSAKSRFKVWLFDHLALLKDRGMIETYECTADYVTVKCAPLPAKINNDAQDEGELETSEGSRAPGKSGKKQRRSRADITILSDLDDKALLKMLETLRAGGIVSDTAYETVREIEKRIGVAHAAGELHRFLGRKWAEKGTLVTSLIRDIQKREKKTECEALSFQGEFTKSAPSKTPRTVRSGATASAASDAESQGSDSDVATKIKEALGTAMRDRNGNLILSAEIEKLLKHL